MTLKINREQAEAAIAEIVAEVGEDYVYDAGSLPACSYRALDDKTKPGCIVGHLVAKLSPEDFPALIEWEDKEQSDDSYDIGTGVQRIPNEILSPVDDATQKFLIKLQGEQDGGAAWGAALDFARRNA